MQACSPGGWYTNLYIMQTCSPGGWYAHLYIVQTLSPGGWYANVYILQAGRPERWYGDLYIMQACSLGGWYTNPISCLWTCLIHNFIICGVETWQNSHRCIHTFFWKEKALKILKNYVLNKNSTEKFNIDCYQKM